MSFQSKTESSLEMEHVRVMLARGIQQGAETIIEGDIPLLPRTERLSRRLIFVESILLHH